MVEKVKQAGRPVLILGGTPEALALTEAAALVPGVAPILSLAGRTWAPRLPAGGLVLTGGFGGVEGLGSFLAERRVRALIDATHPYAAAMAEQAAQACARLGVPRLRLERPVWMPQAGDVWHSVDTMDAAAERIGAAAERVFLSTGHLGLDRFGRCPNAWFLIRAIAPPPAEVALPKAHTVLLARGPFDRAAERALFETHGLTLLISKNSGGTGTYAKIEAARALGVPVLMLARPVRPAGPIAHTVTEALAWLRKIAAAAGWPWLG